VKLRASGNFSLIPLVIVASEMSLSLKVAGRLRVSSYITIPYRAIDLWNGILPTVGSRTVHTRLSSTPSLPILLAEDNDVNIKVAIRILEKNNHVVTVIENGLQALEEI
jgi:osomolarity two-component system sensor histidine kinase NIK1